MRINRILKMKNLGIFRDFSWPAGLPCLARYNLIYGWNGTGKSTIGNMLQSLERKRNVKAIVEIEFDDNTAIEGNAFSTSDIPIRVFNRVFVSNNVFPEDGIAAPIFIIGEENKEKHNRIESLTKELENKEKDLRMLGDELKQIESDFETHCISRAKAIKTTLTAQDSDYNNYNKSDYKETAEKSLTSKSVLPLLLDSAEEQRLMQIHLGGIKEEIDSVDISFSNIQKVLEDTSKILITTVVSSVIESLQDDQELSDWIKEGLSIHKKRCADCCLFCDQTLPPKRIVKLEAHFNKEYMALAEKVLDKIKELQVLKLKIQNIALPDKARIYEDLIEDYKSACEEIKKETTTAIIKLDRFENAMKNKALSPFRAIEMEFDGTLLNDEVINGVNRIINEHNDRSREYIQRKKAARYKLEAHYVISTINEYQNYIKKLDELRIAFAELKLCIDSKKKEKESLEKDIAPHGKTAQELTRELKAYLGHGELVFFACETGYLIKRGNIVADGLSDGEKTAIALLHFLKTLKDSRFDLSNGIVVLDDPVSSLDANALFGAFGFIKSRTKEAKQLIVLTHNYAFYKQIREWFGNLRGPDKKSKSIFMLECNYSGKERKTAIREIDKLLKDYETEYQYLFKYINDIATSSVSLGLDGYYPAPNIARRVLETFLAFRMPNENTLYGKLEAIDFEEEKKSRIYRYTQTHSHRNLIGDQEDDLTILAETPAIMRDILELIKKEDLKHYDNMIKVIS
ncbi:AAA family ATPase [bacterium]|nr:AAA family ATPase [bacterium]